jgi:hypothetical protein
MKKLKKISNPKKIKEGIYFGTGEQQ